MHKIQAGLLMALNPVSNRFERIDPTTAPGRAILANTTSIQVVLPVGGKPKAIDLAIAGRLTQFGEVMQGLQARSDWNGDGTSIFTLTGIKPGTAKYFAALIPVARGKRWPSVKRLDTKRWSQASKIRQSFVTSFLPSGDDAGTKLARANNQAGLMESPYYRAIVRPLFIAYGLL